MESVTSTIYNHYIRQQGEGICAQNLEGLAFFEQRKSREQGSSPLAAHLESPGEFSEIQLLGSRSAHSDVIGRKGAWALGQA